MQVVMPAVAIQIIEQLHHHRALTVADYRNDDGLTSQWNTPAFMQNNLMPRADRGLEWRILAMHCFYDRQRRG